MLAEEVFDAVNLNEHTSPRVSVPALRLDSKTPSLLLTVMNLLEPPH